MSRYENMTGGCSLFEAGQALKTVLPEDTLRVLNAARIKPCGGTLKNPRYDRKLVTQLAAIRESQRKRT